ncbi:dUTP diphosphatase [Clostridium fallax]|uniref:Dimeric dUTPase, all-alpha-NTP-PPase (MazG) superfamily n=1 Tax=Clostridium fallax TaxID=1533 RepID=A0A1M4WZT1_9CLOT|nr:dUTP diphosphatase [Clostridium fallax]SHE86771.1 Dimeric dUTPase, all-alpha-NTP-PPase (MazG) superfamily [Clostridium fallax]SQB22570.1 dUTPase superfamily [Clostridium fallax]
MNLSKFFHQQEEYNKQFLLDKNLNPYKIKARKNLEIQIKIGDLANSTKCFNYCINKDDSISITTIKEKYIDCFCSIISLGLDSNFSSMCNLLIKPNDYCLSDQFLNLYIDVNDLIISPSLDHYKTLLEDYISLGITLGFSIQSIEEQFFKKTITEIAL